jgi:molecular chaperone GrpE
MPDDNQQTDQDDQNNQAGDITIEQIKTDLDQAMAGWKRTAADFENYKKRKEGENKELVEFAREVTVVKLLPTIDSLELALRHMPEYRSPLTYPPAPIAEMEGRVSAKDNEADEFLSKYKNWQTGVNGIVMQLDKVLEELGVKRIEVAAGKTKFDPHFHEAVKEVESEIADQIIMEELQSGFVLNGKVIRPSQVIISKKKST